MRRGFFRLWVMCSALWAAAWLVIGASNGLLVTPAHEVAAPLDRASLGLPADASDFNLNIATLDAGSRGALPEGQTVPAAFNPSGTLAVLGFAASAPALLLAIGWAFAGFSGVVRRG
jgi:hypothetical protein